jgi:arginine/lysine/histidine transporter system substrate-binding protein
MNKFFIITSALLAGAMLFLYIKRQAPSTSATIPDTLIVGTSADFKPFSFKENNTIVGFDIDIAREIAQRLGKNIIFKDMPFELLIPQLQLGTIQCVAAGMTPTPERAQRVLFSQPYLTGDKLIVISRATTPAITSLKDLDHKTVIVNQGYTADRYMSKIPGIELIRLPTVSDALLALQSDRAYAFVTSANSVKPFFEQYGKDQFHIFTIEDAQETTALAISPLYPALAKKIDEIITTIKHDGTIDKLKEKWHLS